MMSSERVLDPQQINLFIYARNNPLKFIDPTGLEITVTGDCQDEYLKRLQSRMTTFKIKINESTNKVEIVYPESSGRAETTEGTVNDTISEMIDNMSSEERALYDAITDTEHNGNIDTGNGKADPDVFFGRYNGESGNKLDFADIKALDSPEAGGVLTGGEVVAHETLEAYKSAKDADTKGAANYTDSHNYASKFVPGTQAVDGTFKYGPISKRGVVTSGSQEFIRAGTNQRFTVFFSFVSRVNVRKPPAGGIQVNVARVKRK